MRQIEYYEQDLSAQIIGAAIEVHRVLGPGLLDFLGSTTFFTHGDVVKHTITEVAEIGVLLLLFMAGLEVDLKMPRNLHVPV